MFRGTQFGIPSDLSKLDTSSVTDMSNMFRTAGFDIPSSISEWDTSSVTNMKSMFRDVESSIPSSISEWDTSSVTDMSNMFRGNTGNDIPPGISAWNVSAVTNMDDMFYGSGSALSACARTYIHASFSVQTSAWPYVWGTSYAAECQQDEASQALLKGPVSAG